VKRTEDGSRARLKGFCEELVDYMRRGMPLGFDGKILDALKFQVRASNSNREIQQLVQDLVESMQGLSPVEVRELDQHLSSRDLPTLLAMRSSENRRFQGILARGQVSTEDEYRFVEARLSEVGPTGPSPSERAIANRLLLAFQD